MQVSRGVLDTEHGPISSSSDVIKASRCHRCLAPKYYSSVRIHIGRCELDAAQHVDTYDVFRTTFLDYTSAETRRHVQQWRMRADADATAQARSNTIVVSRKPRLA